MTEEVQRDKRICKGCEYFGGFEGSNVWCNAGECKFKKKEDEKSNY